MSGQNDSGDKTEQATPKKLRDARKKGQVPKSTELSGSLSMLLALLAVMALVPWFARRVADLLLAVERSLEAPLETATVVQLLAASVELVLVASLLPLGCAAAVSVVATAIQTGGVFSVELVKPKLERMNPVNGLKQVFSMRSLVQLVQALLKTAIVGAAVWLVLLKVLPDTLRVLHHDGGAVLAVVGSALMQLLVWCGGLFVLLGFVDLAYQRWQFARDQRMSIQEVRREYREEEGDPYIKAARRQPPEQFSFPALLSNLRAAALVLTDRHGRAIAIIYKPHLFAGPLYLLRANGERAQAVVDKALTLKIPVHESTELLSAMYVEAEPAVPVSDPMASGVLDVLQRLPRR